MTNIYLSAYAKNLRTAQINPEFKKVTSTGESFYSIIKKIFSMENFSVLDITIAYNHGHTLRITNYSRERDYKKTYYKEYAFAPDIKKEDILTLLGNLLTENEYSLLFMHNRASLYEIQYYKDYSKEWYRLQSLREISKELGYRDSGLDFPVDKRLSEILRELVGTYEENIPWCELITIAEEIEYLAGIEN